MVPEVYGSIPARRRFKYEILQDEETIKGHDKLKSYITSYYKGMFGAPVESGMSLDESRTDDVPQMSPEENMILTAPYSEEQARKAVFQMEQNKVPRSDGFLAKFYQTFWDIIKGDLLLLFLELHAGQLELFRINFGEIIYYQDLMMWKEFNNTDQYVSLMRVSIFFFKNCYY
jgi:hypothetical protein